jgi:hypothetical protein
MRNITNPRPIHSSGYVKFAFSLGGFAFICCVLLFVVVASFDCLAYCVLLSPLLSFPSPSFKELSAIYTLVEVSRLGASY